MRDRFPAPGDDGELTFVTSWRPQPRLVVGNRVGPSKDATGSVKAKRPPTHIVHDGAAYLITPEPFFIGVEIPRGSRGLNLSGETTGISQSHCNIRRRGEQVLVEDHSSFGSFLNDRRLEKCQVAAAGDRLRLGKPGREFQLVAFSDSDGSSTR